MKPEILHNSQLHIEKTLGTAPKPVYFVFHGGSGSPQNQIREAIEQAIEKIAEKKITIFGAGRTDTGVHAIHQVFHFDFNKDINVKKITVSTPPSATCWTKDPTTV